MTIGIIGYGNVGRSTHKMLNPSTPVAVYDPLQGRRDDLGGCQLVFVCLPTPCGGNGHDLSAFDNLPGLDADPMICLRSTVSPGQVKTLQARHPRHSWCYFPEFRTEQNMHDGVSSPFPYFVGIDADVDINLLAKALQVDLVTVPIGALEIAKLSINAVLAMHVAFANEAFDLASKVGTDWEHVRAIMEVDPRTGSHYKVTEERGFSGSCLPKDVAAFIASANTHETSLQILESVIESNDRVRWLTEHQA